MLIHDDFVSFMRAEVLPRKQAHPDQNRLDGKDSGSSRRSFAYFRHHGSVWKVDEDTRYGPLLLAYEAARAGQQPFLEQQTQRGQGHRLVLNDDLRRRHASRFTYMYIYRT